MKCNLIPWTSPRVAYDCLDMLRRNGWLVGYWKVVKCECGEWHLVKIEEVECT